MFRAERIGQALQPEVLGIGTGIGLQLLATGIDTAIPMEQPIMQYMATVVAVGGGAWMVGTGAAPGFANGLLLGGITMVGVNLARSIYEQVTKASVRQRAVDFAALVPRQLAVRPGGSTGRDITFQIKSREDVPVPSVVAAGARGSF